MHKKGFTLIELLAVIVILAIIALITMPLITKVVEKVRLGAVRDSVYNLIDAAELQYINNFQDIVDDSLTFTCDGTKCVTKNGTKLKFKGTVPIGSITAEKDESYVYNLEFGKYCASGTKKDLRITKETCQFAPGIYDSKDNLVISWDDLENKYHFDVEKDYCYDDEYAYRNNTGYNSLRSAVDAWNAETGKDLGLIKKLVIPEGKTRVGNCSLRNAGFGNDGSLFYQDYMNGRGLNEIILPGSLKSIGKQAFDGEYASLKYIIIPDGVTTIGNYAFEKVKTDKIIIGKNVKEIGDYAFERYSDSNEINDIELKSVEVIGERAFNGRKFGTVYLNEDVKLIGEYAFGGTHLLIYTGNLRDILDDGYDRHFGASYLASYIEGDFAYRIYNGKTIEGDEDITYKKIMKYLGKATKITLPIGKDYYDSEAFANTNIKTITLVKDKNAKAKGNNNNNNFSFDLLPRFDYIKTLENIYISGKIDGLKSIDGVLYYVNHYEDTINEETYSLNAIPYKKEKITIPKEMFLIIPPDVNKLSKLKSITFEDTTGWAIERRICSDSSNGETPVCDYITEELDLSNPKSNPKIFADLPRDSGGYFSGTIINRSQLKEEP